jgi:hypothetical protein
MYKTYNKKQSLLFISVCFLTLLAFLKKIALIPDYYISFFEMLIVAILLVVSLTLNQFRLYSISNKVLLPFLAFLLLGLLSNFINTEVNSYSLMQLFLSVKFLLVLFLFMQFKNYNIKILLLILKVILLLSLLLVIFEFFIPKNYYQIFNTTAMQSKFLLFGLNRYSGAFVHPGNLAKFSFCTFIIFLLSYKRGDASLYSITFWLLLSSLLVTLSFQRVELIFLLLALIFVFKDFIKINKTILNLSIFTIATVLIILILVGDAIFNNGTQSSQVGNIAESVPRILIINSGVELANNYFPFGSGFGTFGTGQSINNPSNVYDQTLLSETWWFDTRSFTFDAYWGAMIAETGYIGTTFLLLFLYQLLAFIKRNKSSCFPSGILYFFIAYFLVSTFFKPILNGSIFQLFLIMFTFFYCTNLIQSKK